MGKYYTDYERLEWVKKWKISKLSKAEFSRRNHIAYETLRDWINAYNDLEGRFVRIDPTLGNGNIGNKDDVKLNLLDNEQIIQKSSHFSRFDHSIVVIEYKNIKVTTSLEQALAIMEKIK